MKNIKVDFGEPFKIDNGRYVSTWKMVISGGILQVVRLLNTDWEKLENKVDDLSKKLPKIVCDACKKEQERHEDGNTDSVVCLYCGHRIR